MLVVFWRYFLILCLLLVSDWRGVRRAKTAYPAAWCLPTRSDRGSSMPPLPSSTSISRVQHGHAVIKIPGAGDQGPGTRDQGTEARGRWWGMSSYNTFEHKRGTAAVILYCPPSSSTLLCSTLTPHRPPSIHLHPLFDVSLERSQLPKQKGNAQDSLHRWWRKEGKWGTFLKEQKNMNVPSSFFFLVLFFSFRFFLGMDAICVGHLETELWPAAPAQRPIRAHRLCCRPITALKTQQSSNQLTDYCATVTSVWWREKKVRSCILLHPLDGFKC